MRCEQRPLTGAAEAILPRPSMEVTLNGLTLEVGRPAVDWPETLRQVAEAVTCAALEHAIEFGKANNATIEVWDQDGRLLVAVSANIQASWPR